MRKMVIKEEYCKIKRKIRKKESIMLKKHENIGII